MVEKYVVSKFQGGQGNLRKKGRKVRGRQMGSLTIWDLITALFIVVLGVLFETTFSHRYKEKTSSVRKASQSISLGLPFLWP